MKMIYIINGDPVPLSRPRFAEGGRVYDPQKNQKLMMGIALSSQHDEKPLLTGPLELSVTFFFKVSKRNRKGYHSCRPDLDNCIKMILDVANSILFADDSQIASIIAQKMYDTIPRTEFSLREL